MSSDLLQRLRDAERDPYAAVYDAQGRASLAGNAADEIERLNSVLATRTTAEEKIAPVQGYTPGIPWSMHLEAYDEYCRRYGKQQALIDLEGRNCRGGFSAGELDMFIPGWRERLSELNKLKARIRSLEVNARTPAAIPTATDEQISAWLARHDLDHAIRGTDARAAFEDAQSFAMIAPAHREERHD